MAWTVMVMVMKMVIVDSHSHPHLVAVAVAFESNWVSARAMRSSLHRIHDLVLTSVEPTRVRVRRRRRRERNGAVVAAAAVVERVERKRLADAMVRVH